MSAQDDIQHAALTVLIDGDCPLCSREVAWLRRRDKRGKLRFVDIAADGFDPEPYGVTYLQLMGSIHAVTSEGEMIHGMGVFRAVYRAVGLGWLLAPTAWPVIRPVSDLVYRLFAKVRPLLRGPSGKCDSGTCRAK